MKHLHVWEDDIEEVVHSAVLGALISMEEQCRRSHDPELIPKLMLYCTKLDVAEKDFSRRNTLPLGQTGERHPGGGSKRAPTGL